MALVLQGQTKTGVVERKLSWSNAGADGSECGAATGFARFSSGTG
jgi:hypothetical protein